MSRLTLIQGLLLNLSGQIAESRREYLPADAAYAKLKELTGQDFGRDIKAWREWLKKNRQPGQMPSQE